MVGSVLNIKNSNKYLRERCRVLRFSVKFQLVFRVEPFLTERACEGLFSRVYEDMPGEVVGLFEGAATLSHCPAPPREYS